MERRRSIAIVTPLPPVKSGISDYSQRILPELSRRFDVIVFRDNPRSDGVRDEVANARVYPISMYPVIQEMEQIDLTIVAMGNNPIHNRSFRLLQEYRPIAWCHDVWLGGFFAWNSAFGFTPPLSQTIRDRFGSEVAHEFVVVERTSSPNEKFLAYHDLLRRRNIFLSWQIADVASEIWVHSAGAADVVRFESEPSSTIPVIQVPFAFPTAVVGHENRQFDESETRVISSFGIASPEKGTEALLNAFAPLAAGIPRLQLRIVGPINQTYREQLLIRASSLGILDHVVITGELSSPSYLHELSIASVAVQLRTVFNGEASAAVSDVLAAGIPSIVTRLGWMGEIPKDVVSQVEPGNEPWEITDELRSLLQDKSTYLQMSKKSREFALKNSFQTVGSTICDLIERRLERDKAP